MLVGQMKHPASIQLGEAFDFIKQLHPRVQRKMKQLSGRPAEHLR